MAVASSYLADHLRQKGVLSTTATRKIFTAFGRLICDLQAEIQFNNIYIFSAVYAWSVDDGARLLGPRCHLGCESLHPGPVRTWSCYRRLLGQWPGHCTQFQWHHFWHGQLAVIVWWLSVHMDGRRTDLQRCMISNRV